jgi:hypothetical protein
LILLFGSLAFLAEVSFFFAPSIQAQNDLRLLASFSVFGFGAGGLRLPPVDLLYEALPLAFNPPLGSLPSLRVHAADLAITFSF